MVGSGAVKNLLHLAQLPYVAVRQKEDPAGVRAWTGADNAPVVMHENEPARTSWAAIVGLVARLAPGRILPVEPSLRASVMGALELLAGEDGLGWNVRLWMVHEGLNTDGASGFPTRAAGYLAQRYGYEATAPDALLPRMDAQLAALEHRLAGAKWFGGSSPDALDVYVASFLTMLTPLSEEDCPGFSPPLRAAFLHAATVLGARVPASLVAHRSRMFAEHLSWPARL